MCIACTDTSWTDRTVTDEDGYYVFRDLYPLFDYEIAPSIYCPEYEPASRTIEHPTEDHHDQDFTAVTPQFVYIMGCVRDPYGAPVEGVTIEFSYRWPLGGDGDTPDPSAGATQHSVETDAGGHYRIPTPSCDFVEVSPAEPGCFAVPHSRSYGPRTDIDGEDYILFCGEGYTISGHLKNEHGQPIAHREVNIKDRDFPYFGWYEVRSDEAGYYEFTNLPWGLDYEVKPDDCSGYLPDCTCEPAQREYESLDRDHIGQDFIITQNP
jgi:hypothetical protein